MLPTFGFLGKPLVYLFTYFILLMGFYIYFLFLENRDNLKSPLPRRQPKVSIIIPMYNGGGLIADCLESLKSLDYPRKKLEIIVVDDGSTDESLKEARRFSGVRVFRKKHSGKAETINYGLTKSTGELVGILDCDSIVKSDSLMEMVGYFQEKGVAAVVSGIRVREPKTLLEKFQDIEYMITLFFRKNFSFVGGLFITPGVLSLYRKSILKQLGGFRDNITEDLEIALRLLGKDYKILCAPEAKTYTKVPDNFKDLERQRVRWNYGLIYNLKTHFFLFSGRYRELGLFVLPTAVLTPIFLIIFCSYITLTLIIWAINSLYMISLTGVEPYFINLLNIHLHISYLNSEFFIFSAITIAFSVAFFLYMTDILSVKRNFGQAFQYFFYVFTSSYIYFYFWLVTFYKIFKKDIEW